MIEEMKENLQQVDEIEQQVIEIQIPTNANIIDEALESKSKLVSTTSIGKKDKPKKNNRRVRPIIDKFDQFLPQFLIDINLHKFKSIVRLGNQYQINVPKQVPFKQIYRSLNHLKVWSADKNNFDEEILKKFRQNFGQLRTEEQLCHLLIQYNCSWDQITNQFMKRKGELRKYYFQKDRSRI